MNNQLKTISVGIPAYNEEGNIKQLVESLLSQKISSGVLKEIIVVADAPTDNTVARVKEVVSPLIHLVELPQRKGLNNGENVIVEKAEGDALVMMDADVLPDDEFFIERAIEPIIKDSQVGIVGVHVCPAAPDTFFESFIVAGHNFRNEIFVKLNAGDNIYLCHGCCRVFSKPFYKKIVWPEKVAEDSYSYLFGKKYGFKFVYAPAAKVLLRAPSVFHDHLNQSVRFAASKKELEDHFLVDEIKKAFSIPLSLALKQLVLSSLKDPIKVLGYALVTLYSRTKSLWSAPVGQSLIEPPKSTKVVVRK